MAYTIEFDGPVNIEAQENRVVVFGSNGPAPIAGRGRLLGGLVKATASGNVEVRITSGAARTADYTGGAAGREDGQLFVTGRFIIRKDPADPPQVQVKVTSTATLAATTAQAAAGAGTDALQAEARADIAWGPLRDRKRQREDRVLDGSPPRRADVNFTDPTLPLDADNSYAFTVGLVLEAVKTGTSGTGTAEATFGGSPGALVSTLTIVPTGEPEQKKAY